MIRGLRTVEQAQRVPRKKARLAMEIRSHSLCPGTAMVGLSSCIRPPLRYPRSAQRRNLEGKAVVGAYLDMQGKLLRARVLQADHEDFADAALACVQASSFKPAQRVGKTIPCVVRIPMLFKLNEL